VTRIAGFVYASVSRFSEKKNAFVENKQYKGKKTM
jgi:hypothetical protein